MKFYRVFNCIFSKPKAANFEIVTVELQVFLIPSIQTMIDNRRLKFLDSLDSMMTDIPLYLIS